MTLFDGTTRLAQIAFFMVIFGVVVAVLAPAAGGSKVLGPIMLFLAAAPAVATVVRDREDYAMWPAYAALGLVVVGLVCSVPFMFAKGAQADIARDGKVARDEFVLKEHAIERAVATCTPDTPSGCSANAIATTQDAISANIRFGSQCTTSDAVCVADGSNGEKIYEFITRPVKDVGQLRLEITRTRENKPVGTVCRPLASDVDMELVRVACGKETTVGTPAGLQG